MIISAIIIGAIIMTLAGNVSRISSQEFNPNPTKYQINMIEDEADKLNMSAEEGRERFKHTLELIDTHTTEATYWEEQNCMNVSMYRIGENFELGCLS